MTTCPKCRYARQPHDNHVHAGICPRCGIAYEKWLAQQQVTSEEDSRAGKSAPNHADAEVDNELEYDEVLPWRQRVWERFTEVPVHTDQATWWGRAATWCALLAWTLYFAWHGVDWEIIGGSFLHNINLAFHEFGHVFFAPFGRFMMILGGSLFQVLLPLGLMLGFTLYQRENFGAAVMLWWCGQSFVDLSPYIRDAMYRGLPLVGGGGEESHDWGNLLTMLDCVDRAPLLGDISFGIGCVIMLAGLVWGGYILYLQYLVMKGEIVFE